MKALIKAISSVGAASSRDYAIMDIVRLFRGWKPLPQQVYHVGLVRSRCADCIFLCALGELCGEIDVTIFTNART